MREHPDFIPELDFVAIAENKIVGNITYIKSCVVDESSHRIETTTFGPISVLPTFQRQGIGSALIRHSREIALVKGYKAIIIQGYPYNYCKHGFKSSKDYNISNAEGKFTYSLLVLELEKGILEGHCWRYYSSDVYNIDGNAVNEYDQLFVHKEKSTNPHKKNFVLPVELISHEHPKKLPNTARTRRVGLAAFS